MVYSNPQHIALTLLTGFKIWLVLNCQTKEGHLNIKIFIALLLYNACTLINMMQISVTNNKKLKIHPRGIATFKKSNYKMFNFNINVEAQTSLVPDNFDLFRK